MPVPIWAFEYSPTVEDGGGIWATAGASGVAILTVAAATCAAVLYAVAVKHNHSHGDSGSAIELFGGGRSKPVSISVASFYACGREFARLGAIMLFSYVCEHFPFFPHAEKDHDMDMFWFLTLALFVAAAFTLEKSKSTDLLHREQTEEWKGWMQFMFLLYHYLHADEVYNAIRVMITCYVWLTGFGNFSFFYIKGDFGAVRVLQMLWRLNFLVGMLVLVHGNTYVLYYICPLHTFYFLLTYGVMRVFQSLNRSKWAIRAKLFVTALLIYLIWDTQLGIFDMLFGWLGTEPKMGATAGTEYEWYFRTSLDHYSTVLGMVFALNYPVSKAFFESAGNLPTARKALVLGSGTLIAVGLLAFWGSEYYSLAKVEYNATNAYMAPLALTCYIFLRNALPVLRSRHSYLLHEIGKTTLETYLLQHHLWLTSNAKTLLVLVPGMPKVNFLLVTIIYYVCARECYRLTMSLRGMFLPEGNASTCLRNLALLTTVVLGAFGVGWVLAAGYWGRVEHLSLVLGAGVALGFSFLTLLERFRPKTTLSVMPEFLRTAPRLALVGFLFVGLVYFYGPGEDRPVAPPAACVAAVQRGAWVYRSNVDTLTCLGASSKGKDGETITGLSALEGQVAGCQTQAWQWAVDKGDAAGCGFAMHNKHNALARVPKDLKVAVVGDSEGRKAYFALRRLLLGDATEMTGRHTDLTPLSADASGVQISFSWAPEISSTATALSGVLSTGLTPHVVILSVGLWDLLEGTERQEYERQFLEVAAAMHNAEGVASAFVQPPTIIDDKLNTAEKLERMTEEKVALLRAQHARDLEGKADIVLDFHELTAAAFSATLSTDGVHYTPLYYDVLAQQVVNALPYIAAEKGLDWKYAQNQSRETGGMANAPYGLGLLVAIAVMLITFDAFGGSTLGPAYLFGTVELKGALRYEVAYKPFLPTSQKAPGSPGSAQRAEEGEAVEKEPLVGGDEKA